MAEDQERYWRQWEKLLGAAADIQGLLPGAVLIGGSAASIHLKHRYSFDADHILSVELGNRLADSYKQP